MRILIDFNHPAHVHLFKNFIWEMQKKGHKFKLIARDKECTLQLLDAYGFKYLKRKGYRGIKKLFGMFYIDWKLLRIAKKFKPDILIGGVGNCYIAQVGWFLRKPAYIFDDTEHSKVQNWLTFPFATKIFTPSCFELDLGKKQVRYDGVHELFYLHPSVFKPDPTVLAKEGLKKGDKFFIVRFVDWQASHDIGDHGFKDKVGFVKKLEKSGKVLISAEGKLPEELEKYRIRLHPSEIHHLMFYTTMFIGESATMASECAVMGIPAIFIGQTSRGYINMEIKQRLVKWRKNEEDVTKLLGKFDKTKLEYDYISIGEIIK